MGRMVFGAWYSEGKRYDANRKPRTKINLLLLKECLCSWWFIFNYTIEDTEKKKNA